MYRENSSRIVKVTPRDAERFLTYNNLGPQRPLRSNHITNLANLMREGLFRIGEIGLAILEYKNNEIVMINGQHQCNAIIVSNKPVKVTLSEYTCYDAEDVALLYRQFDNHAARSLSNVLKVEAYSLDLSWPSKLTSLIVGAAAIKEDLIKAPKNHKTELLKNYVRQGHFLYELLFVGSDGIDMNKDYAHLRRLPTVYAIMLCWEKSQKDAKEFWTQVRDGEDLNRKMPAYKLRNFLTTHTYSRGRGAMGAPNKQSNFHQMASRCITAWNAYRRGTITTLKVYENKPIPKPI